MSFAVVNFRGSQPRPMCEASHLGVSLAGSTGQNIVQDLELQRDSTALNQGKAFCPFFHRKNLRALCISLARSTRPIAAGREPRSRPAGRAPWRAFIS
ncbi:hypothetical protein FBQ98_09665 [Gammaproteobacteria bacterium PRO6]|nr:hypothetical protein [Gammaproteobacteria bacterium PRO6]